jgi:hypothetical protein
VATSAPPAPANRMAAARTMVRGRDMCLLLTGSDRRGGGDVQ